MMASFNRPVFDNTKFERQRLKNPSWLYRSGPLVLIAALGAAALAACRTNPQSNIGEHQFDHALSIPPLVEPEFDDRGLKVFDLTFNEGESELIPGQTTRTWGLNGAYLGPTM